MASASSSPEDELLGAGTQIKFPDQLFTIGRSDIESDFKCEQHSARNCLCYDYLTRIQREDQTMLYSEPRKSASLTVNGAAAKKSGKKFSLADYKERKKMDALKANDGGTPLSTNGHATPSPSDTTIESRKLEPKPYDPPRIRLDSPPYMGPAPRNAGEKRAAAVLAEKYELLSPHSAKRARRTPPPSPPRERPPSRNNEARPRPRDRSPVPPPPPREKPAPPRRSPARLSPGLPSVVEDALLKEETPITRTPELEPMPPMLSPTLPSVVEAALRGDFFDDDDREPDRRDEREKDRPRERKPAAESTASSSAKKRDVDSESLKSTRDARDAKPAKLSKDAVIKDDVEVKKTKKAAPTTNRPAATSSTASKTLKKEKDNRLGSESPPRKAAPKAKPELKSKAPLESSKSKASEGAKSRQQDTESKPKSRPAPRPESRSSSEEPLQKRSSGQKKAVAASKSLGPRTLLVRIRIPSSLRQQVAEIFDPPRPPKAGKRPAPTEKEDLAPPSKRPKMAEPAQPISKSTPRAAISTPRPGTADSISTPQKRRVEGRREEPRVETPGSVARLDSRKVGEAAHAQSKIFMEEYKKYLTKGTSLKHEAEGKGLPREEIEALDPSTSLIKMVDGVLCYVIAFASEEESNRLLNRPIGKTWMSLLPLLQFACTRAISTDKGRPIFGLLKSITAWVCQHVVDISTPLIERMLRNELERMRGSLDSHSPEESLTPINATDKADKLQQQLEKAHNDFLATLRVSRDRQTQELFIPLKNLAEARAAATQDFHLEVLISQFPQTWRDRARSPEKVQERKFEPGKYSSPYLLPIGPSSTVLEVVNIGYAVLSEWASANGVEFKRRIR